MERYADRAIKELKREGKWTALEERISYDCGYAPKRSPTRALLLIILRGETAKTIPIRLELKRAKMGRVSYIEEIKRQLLEYFATETHRSSAYPKAFTVVDVLKQYPEISEWFHHV